MGRKETTLSQIDDLAELLRIVRGNVRLNNVADYSDLKGIVDLAISIRHNAEAYNDERPYTK